MNRYIADTMAIVLYIENRRLPTNIKNIFLDALNGDSTIYVSAVSLMEIGYLFEKQRIDASISSVLSLADRNKSFIIHSLDSATVLEAFKIKDIPELHDRLIAASTSVLDATLITNDPIIQRSNYVDTIW